MKRKRKTKRSTVVGIIFFLLAAALLETVPGRADPLPGDAAEFRDASATEEISGKPLVHLYFGDRQPPYLKSEQRMLEKTTDPAAFGKQVLDALLAGPTQPLERVAPEGTTVRAFFLAGDGTGYADLSATLRDRHPGGSDAEMQTVYAIVNSLVLNVPGVERVQILIDGRMAETLAGQIAMDRPYAENMLLIR